VILFSQEQNLPSRSRPFCYYGGHEDFDGTINRGQRAQNLNREKIAPTQIYPIKCGMYETKNSTSENQKKNDLRKTVSKSRKKL
jgi:hypothetical protein